MVPHQELSSVTHDFPVSSVCSCRGENSNQQSFKPSTWLYFTYKHKVFLCAMFKNVQFCGNTPPDKLKQVFTLFCLELYKKLFTTLVNSSFLQHTFRKWFCNVVLMAFESSIQHSNSRQQYVTISPTPVSHAGGCLIRSPSIAMKHILQMYFPYVLSITDRTFYIFLKSWVE